MAWSMVFSSSPGIEIDPSVTQRVKGSRLDRPERNAWQGEVMVPTLLRQEKGRRTSPQNPPCNRDPVLSETMRLNSSGFSGPARTAPGVPAR
jgi:hypothetical protein